MAIDFHAEKNSNTYAGRAAEPGWGYAIRRIVDPTGKRVVDVGCGGGIYTAAWADLGAGSVTGVDFSAQMVRDATKANRGRLGVSIHWGDAADTGLPEGSADIVFSRAVIHHLPDLAACFEEASRLLRPGGMYIVQDRTPEDVALPGSPDHLRGYFFEVFPRLSAVEAGRRPTGDTVRRGLEKAGFTDIAEEKLWELRKRHVDKAALAADLRGRIGRSILHELSDAELETLVEHIETRLPIGEIVEQDRWTIWHGRK
jgi:ubiquinone/menaquinone biosynthesis C-methylase UbiE